MIAFTVVIQLIYLLSLPKRNDYSDLTSIFFVMGIFEIIVAAILICSVYLYLRRIYLLNRKYGKAVLGEAFVFIISNIIAGSFNFWITNNGYVLITLLNLDDTTPSYSFNTTLIAYVILTELVPSLTFVYTMSIFNEVIHGE